jgi:hypothetical protein
VAVQAGEGGAEVTEETAAAEVAGTLTGVVAGTDLPDGDRAHLTAEVVRKREIGPVTSVTTATLRAEPSAIDVKLLNPGEVTVETDAEVTGEAMIGEIEIAGTTGETIAGATAGTIGEGTIGAAVSEDAEEAVVAAMLETVTGLALNVVSITSLVGQSASNVMLQNKQNASNFLLPNKRYFCPVPWCGCDLVLYNYCFYRPCLIF